jgi:hypothetical protein
MMGKNGCHALYRTCLEQKEGPLSGTNKPIRRIAHMTITTQEQMLEEVIKKMQLIRDLTFIAEKGEDEMRYATFRIRVQSRQIIDTLEKVKQTSNNVQGVFA